MDRWTKKQLEEMDDISFAMCILRERKEKVSPYSPLGVKLSDAIHTLGKIVESEE